MTASKVAQNLPSHKNSKNGMNGTNLMNARLWWCGEMKMPCTRQRWHYYYYFYRSYDSADSDSGKRLTVCVAVPKLCSECETKNHQHHHLRIERIKRQKTKLIFVIVRTATDSNRWREQLKGNGNVYLSRRVPGLATHSRYQIAYTKLSSRFKFALDAECIYF